MKGDQITMAAKKNATVNKEETKSVAKATVKKVPAKVEEVKAEAPKAEEAKAETPEVAAAPVAEKKAAVKAEAKKPAVKKAASKPAAKKAVSKKEVKTEITLQFSGKAFSQDELTKIAKDVWKYDLKQKPADLTSIELYVKPEENVAYYVMNKEFTGSFYL